MFPEPLEFVRPAQPASEIALMTTTILNWSFIRRTQCTPNWIRAAELEEAAKSGRDKVIHASRWHTNCPAMDTE